MLKSIHVLFVEDQSIIRNLSKYTFSQMTDYKFLVDYAEHGVEAVQKAKTQHYDLIFMDLNLPQMDGLDAAKQINALNKKIPIIAVTAHNYFEKREACKNAGIIDFLPKPFTVANLSEVLHKWQLTQDEKDQNF